VINQPPSFSVFTNFMCQWQCGILRLHQQQIKVWASIPKEQLFCANEFSQHTYCCWSLCSTGNV